MIDERQRKTIELLISGEHTVTSIAEVIGVSRQAIYNWMNNNDEFKAELDKRLLAIKHQAEKEFNSKLLIAIDEYWKIAMSSTDMRTKEKALQYWIDRSLGRVTSRLELNDERTEPTVSDEDILSDIDELDGEEGLRLVQ